MVRKIRWMTVAALMPLALAGCGSGGDDAGNDSAQIDLANAADPQLTSALQSQIMVDPSLGQQSNGDAIRPPGQPYAGGVPPEGVAAGGDAGGGQLLRAPAPVSGEQCNQCETAREAVTLGGLAQRQRDQRTSGCAAKLQYSAGWAQRLPADLPLHPQARVTEAAGTEGGACKLRVVSFSVAQPMQHMLDWYYTKAVRGGYTAEHQADGAEHVLGGTRDKDDGAYVLFMTARADGGTDVDLVANNGI